MESTRTRRAMGVLLAAAAAAAAVLALASPAGAATGASRALQPSDFDFSDCPALPPGLDPARWRCEVHLATADLVIGRVTLTGIALRVTHAEGPLPDGTPGQVFGALRSRPVVVPQAATADRGRDRLTLQVRYAGYADLIGNGPDPGGLYLTLAVRGAGARPGCSIGSPADPIRIHPARTGSVQTIPTDPPIRVFTMRDAAFAVPASSGCGRAGQRLDERLGLPAATGNAITLDTAYTYRTYDSLGR